MFFFCSGLPLEDWSNNPNDYFRVFTLPRDGQRVVRKLPQLGSCTPKR